MKFKFHIGTKIYFGNQCVKENGKELAKFGKKAVIVTGKHSAKACGALDDITCVLNEIGIEYLIFDRVENNPSLENVGDGGRVAAEFNADFIIGIGGGSPLDAAKAISVLAVNNIEPVDLYKNSFENKPLPIIAVPTTAGTGSEVTPYSILTRKDMQTKMSFGNEDTFPAIAFIDAAYTESLPYDVTVNTAIDALSHAVEGYLSRRSTPASDVLAEEALEKFSGCIEKLLQNSFDHETREKLIYVSMLAGMVIAQTGTTIVHGMGYSLTYFRNIPHGRANGLLMAEYLRYNYEAAARKTDNILSLLKLKSIDEFDDIMRRLMKPDIKPGDDELRMYASLAIKQRSASYNVRPVTEEDMYNIMKNSF